jgi:glycine/D-amino acid oxidase-like deaminating enzyme/nitrite reductase/ring-hydroxylating ferredoxin subunit
LGCIRKSYRSQLSALSADGAESRELIADRRKRYAACIDAVMAQILDTKSYWMRTAALPTFAPLDRNVTVDAVVVGAGLTGISTAHLLKSAGLSVALLERDAWAANDTGHTSAHLTMVTDEFITDLVKDFGRDTAIAVWDAGRLALDQIEANVTVDGIDCEFQRVPGYLLPALEGTGASPDELREQADLAAELGFAVSYAPNVQPFSLPGVRFESQALFHPRQYLAGLLRAIPGNGSHVFEHTAVDDVTDGPLTVHAGAHQISCGFVVLATHTPHSGTSSFLSATLLQSKLAPYSTYVVAGRLPPDAIEPGLYWDTADPYHYLRVERREGHAFAIFGGADHKTGQQADTTACWTTLDATLRQRIPSFELTDRWSGQVVETVDGLPYIGETAAGQFVATGFAGNGMTFGTLAAMMARDAILQRPNLWRDVFDPHRKSIRAGAWDYLKENKDYALYMLRDRVAARHATSLGEVRRGQGAVVSLDGSRVAAYRNSQGVVQLCSAICTHMGCEVQFNAAETSWDCPCHGSRFRTDGTVLAGPAQSALAPHDQ